MFGGYVDGLAVVCGGEDSSGSIYSTCYFLDLQVNMWVPFQDMTIERSFAASVVVDGCLVISGGKTNSGATDLFDFIGESCESSPLLEYSLPAPIYGHCFLNLGEGQFMTIGGSPGHYGDAFYFRSDGVWEQRAAPQKVRDGHDCATVTTGEGELGVLVAGNSFSPADLAEVYFPHNDTWVWTAWMNSERAGGKIATFEARPLLLGGYGGDYWSKQYYKSGEYYSMMGDFWRTRTSRNLTEGRKEPAVIMLPQSYFTLC